jgi:hypothetical protein
MSEILECLVELTAISPITGLDIVVTRRRSAAMKRKATPM